MNIFKRVAALWVMMVCFIAAIQLYLFSNRMRIYVTKNSGRVNISVDQLYQTPNERTIPLLTIFTTIKEKGDIPYHQLAFNISMSNWPSFAPYIRPVMFLNFTNSPLADEVIQAGWDVLQLEGTNSAGTPFLKDMYRAVFDRYESSFYGFANADILFDDSLIKTLLEVERKLELLKSNVLVMGRRTNVDVNLNDTALFERFQKHRLRDLAAKKGQLFAPYAIDYFFFTNEGCSLKWSQLANMVIGRPAYDNYLVAMAIRHKVNVIDATNTVLAVHVSEPGKHFHGSQNKDANFNRGIIGKFRYVDGYASAAELNTVEDFLGNVFIVNRRKKKS